MELVNFNNYDQNDRMYGGTAGRKIGIDYKGYHYLLKFPGNLKEQHMKNIQMSYSNSPICEYIGSKIYHILGIPVHETILGKRNDKIVTACQDFLRPEETLYEFEKIKVTFEPPFLDSNGNETNGNGSDLQEVLMTIQTHPFLRNIEGTLDFFWNMFVVDAFIGNGDRNNSNWGIVLSADGRKRIAPVYDNGNCLNCKWDDIKMSQILSNEQSMITEAYKGRRCIYEMNGKRVNPYQFIEQSENRECRQAIIRLVPVIKESMEQIKDFILDIPVISDIQKQFYIQILELRYMHVLCPAYENK